MVRLGKATPDSLGSKSECCGKSMISFMCTECSGNDKSVNVFV